MDNRFDGIQEICGSIFMNEFDVIERYFVPLTMGQAGSVGLKDDGAVVSIPEGHELVLTSDTLNESIHFLRGEDPVNIAHKALRVNLSDLASMGADPICYQLNLAFPEKPTETWLERFTGALMADQALYGIYCSGGDTTSIKGGYLSVSITAMGCVPKGKAVRRGGAQDGDLVVLTGCIGDAVLGLKALQKGLNRETYAGAISRYLRPLPRIQSVDLLRRYAHAAADISDGFIADLQHIAEASGVGSVINLSNMKFSEEVQKAIGAGLLTLEEALSGGDDYELVLAVAPLHYQEFLKLMNELNIEPFVVGEFKKNDRGVKLYHDNGEVFEVTRRGWSHF